jgi:hypothetical protein
MTRIPGLIGLGSVKYHCIYLILYNYFFTFDITFLKTLDIKGLPSRYIGRLISLFLKSFNKIEG